MKGCSKCGELKPPSEYYVKDSNSGRLHAHCKACYREHRKTYYAEHFEKYGDEYRLRARKYRKKLREEYRNGVLSYLKDKSCADCGEDNIVVLEFDHIDPSRKSFSVSQAVKLGYGWKQVQDEINKCEVVCANCHKKRTARQFGWYKLR